jgi:hypothetical protein
MKRDEKTNDMPLIPWRGSSPCPPPRPPSRPPSLLGRAWIVSLVAEGRGEEEEEHALERHRVGVAHVADAGGEGRKEGREGGREISLP